MLQFWKKTSEIPIVESIYFNSFLRNRMKYLAKNSIEDQGLFLEMENEEWTIGSNNIEINPICFSFHFHEKRLDISAMESVKETTNSRSKWRNPMEFSWIIELQKQLVSEQKELFLPSKLLEKTIAFEFPKTHFLNRFFSFFLQTELLFIKKEIVDLYFQNKEEKAESLYYIQTNLRQGFVIYNLDNFQFLEYSGALSIEKKLGRNKIVFSQGNFKTTLFNGRDYSKLERFLNLESFNLDVYIDVLFSVIYNEKWYFSLLEMLRSIPNEIDLISNEFKIYLYPYLNNNSLKNIDLKDFKICLNKFLNKSKNIDSLQLLFINGSVSIEEWDQFIDLILVNQKNKFSSKLIDFHSCFRTLYLNQNNKKEEDRFRVNYRFAKHLLEANQLEEAENMYFELLESLPDESIQEFVPDNKVNLFEEKEDNLHLRILKELVSFISIKSSRYFEAHQKLLVLHPFDEKLLLKVRGFAKKEYVHKIQEVLNCLAIPFCSNQENLNGIIFPAEVLDNTSLLNSVSPDCFKNVTGFWESLKTQLAKTNKPDYSQLIEFSDRLDENKYKDIHELIKTVSKKFNQDVPECYIGRGNYSIGIMGLTLKPAVFIIGSDHLDKNSDYYLNEEQLAFLIANEWCILLNNFSRISAKDLWSGIGTKSFSVIETTLSVIPIIGTIGGLVGSVAKLGAYTKVLNTIQSIGDYGGKGISVIETTSKYADKLTSKEKKKQSLLVTSRLMEIVSDRYGLFFTKNLSNVVIAILFSHKEYAETFQSLQNKGLQYHLNSKENGVYVHQEMLFRIKMLASYYLSY